MKHTTLFFLLFVFSQFLPKSAHGQWNLGIPKESVIDIEVRDGNTFVLASGGLHMSTDGQVWHKITIPAGQRFNSVVALNAQELFLFGNDRYYKSMNGGGSWTRVSGPGSSARHCIADAYGFLYLGDNQVTVSMDKGTTWTTSAVGMSTDFFDVGKLAVSEAGSIYAGNVGITGGMVYRSMDNGSTWSLVHSQYRNDIADIFLSSSAAYLAYRDRILYSFDDGSNWFAAASVPEGHLTALWFVNMDIGYAGTWEKGLFETTDAGESWQPITAISSKSIVCIASMSNGRLLVGGDSGLFVQAASDVSSPRSEQALTISTKFFGRDLIMSTSEPAQIELIDQLGRMVISVGSLENNTPIRLSTASFAKGAYIAVARSPKAIASVKVSLY